MISLDGILYFYVDALFLDYCLYFVKSVIIK